MNLNWAHRPLSRLVAMALPSPTARAALKDKRTELRGYRGWVRPHSGGAIQRRMTLGWGTVIRGSHHGQSPDFILGPLHNLNPLALALYIGLLAPVDILAGAETVLILHPASLPAWLHYAMPGASSTKVSRNPLPSYLAKSL